MGQTIWESQLQRTTRPGGVREVPKGLGQSQEKDFRGLRFKNISIEQ
jgi:hypothetical protein